MRDGLQHAASFDPIGFLGPPGTFTEEALLADEELARSELVSYSSIAEALAAADCGEVGAAFVPMENSIEGTVPVTLDHLVFDSQLLIQKEAVLDVHLHLLAPVGLALEDIRRIVSFPHASAQCRRFLRQHVPLAELIASNSTADAARKVGANEMPGAAAIAPLLAGRLYGLEPVAEEIEDYDDNQTRFVLVAPGIVPPPSGHDRTSIVCFQGTDRPGSLLQIL
ncbi:MAG: prephenate dehydratase, partial [Acidimicrobiales bacterium]